MTGYGSASIVFNQKTISVEIKSVNSKFLDANLRLPASYREKEFELRTEIGRIVERGKAEVSVTVDSSEPPRRTSINAPLIKSYYEDLKAIDIDLNLHTPDFLKIILPLPDVLSTGKAALDEDEWKALKSAVEAAGNNFIAFRKQEGLALQHDLEFRIGNILSRLKEIESFEKGRLEVIRERLRAGLEEFIQANNIDRNRFEQELIYYIEKFDISEEKVRLKSHCEYFIQTIHSQASSGKKLSFISQEIGREINTIGSKANDAGMQKAVVEAKEELEKIKEQVLNIL